MKKRLLPLLLMILLTAACGKSAEQADIADYYREIYGEDRVIERRGLYYELIYRYVLNRVWEDRFYILPLAGESEEPYEGDEFSLAPDRSVYDVGETVNIELCADGEDITYGAELRLDYWDDSWYQLNTNFSYPSAEYTLKQGETAAFELTDKTLAQASLYDWDETDGMYVLRKEERSVKLRPGRYRYMMTVRDLSGVEYRLACEFLVERKG